MQTSFDLFGSPVGFDTEPEAEPRKVADIFGCKKASPGDALSMPTDISAEQYFALAEAVMISAIESAFGESRGGTRYDPRGETACEAWSWLITKTNPLDEDYPFTFENCARACCCDPQELRDTLVALRQRLSLPL